MNGGFDGPRISAASDFWPTKSHREPSFPDSPSSLLTSVFGVGVFDWTVTNIHVSAFLGCFECRRRGLYTSRAVAIPGRTGAGPNLAAVWKCSLCHHFLWFWFCNTGLNRGYISGLFLPFSIYTLYFIKARMLKNGLALRRLCHRRYGGCGNRYFYHMLLCSNSGFWVIMTVANGKSLKMEDSFEV